MARTRKDPEYVPHPLLEELRPSLKRSARRSLLKSMEKVGQLSEILVTADGYILDGRTRFELAKELGAQPRIRHLSMHSCVGELPPGYDHEWEMEQVRDVIEETGRGRWMETQARRLHLHELAQSVANCELAGSALADGLTGSKPLEELYALPVGDANPLGIRLRPEVREHLDLMAVKVWRSKRMGGRPSTADYVRRLCVQDYLLSRSDMGSS